MPYTARKDTVLAELLNVSHGYISRIESGKKGCSVDLMIQISEIFGTSLDYLILGKCHDVLDMSKTRKIKIIFW